MLISHQQWVDWNPAFFNRTRFPTLWAQRGLSIGSQLYDITEHGDSLWDIYTYRNIYVYNRQCDFGICWIQQMGNIPCPKNVLDYGIGLIFSHCWKDQGDTSFLDHWRWWTSQWFFGKCWLDLVCVFDESPSGLMSFQPIFAEETNDFHRMFLCFSPGTL